MLKDLNQSAEQKSSMELPPIFSPVRQSGRPKISKLLDAKLRPEISVSGYQSTQHLRSANTRN